MTKRVRTRFAPSPTGYLHVGGARTALFNWLFARHFGGDFILRIEDTDLERSNQESVTAILSGLEWLGLDYDEGPFYQTQRFDRYHAVIQQLVNEGNAYKCYCSKERLEKLRDEQQQNKEKPRYDGLCRERKDGANDSPYVIRFKNPLTGDVTFDDMIRGKITVNNSELDDLIIARTDGTPTYNLTVVVDDCDMQITHVIRGDDHINNTPRQINILKALNADLPLYAHVPMILGSDGKRLSKRHGAVAVTEYKEQGILPEALLNYLVRLGWAHKDQEIFSRAEMVELFNITAVSRSPAAFDPNKLLWLNQHYLKTLSPLILASLLKQLLVEKNIVLQDSFPLENLISIQAERSKTLLEIIENSRFFFEDFADYDLDAATKHLQTEIIPPLKAIADHFTTLTDWQTHSIHAVILEVAEKFQLKLGKLAQPIRVAVTGNTTSPSIDITLMLIGKERTLRRLKKAIAFAEKTA